MTQNLVVAATEAETEARLRREVDRLNDRADGLERERDGFEHELNIALGELESLKDEQAAASARPYRPDAKRIDSGDWERACGQSICDVCGCLYFEHAPVQGFSWIHRLCDGRLVKL